MRRCDGSFGRCSAASCNIFSSPWRRPLPFCSDCACCSNSSFCFFIVLMGSSSPNMKYEHLHIFTVALSEREHEWIKQTWNQVLNNCMLIPKHWFFFITGCPSNPMSMMIVPNFPKYVFHHNVGALPISKHAHPYTCKYICIYIYIQSHTYIIYIYIYIHNDWDLNIRCNTLSWSAFRDFTIPNPLPGWSLLRGYSEPQTLGQRGFRNSFQTMNWILEDTGNFGILAQFEYFVGETTSLITSQLTATWKRPQKALRTAESPTPLQMTTSLSMCMFRCTESCIILDILVTFRPPTYHLKWKFNRVRWPLVNKNIRNQTTSSWRLWKKGAWWRMMVQYHCSN